MVLSKVMCSVTASWPVRLTISSGVAMEDEEGAAVSAVDIGCKGTNEADFRRSYHGYEENVLCT